MSKAYSWSITPPLVTNPIHYVNGNQLVVPDLLSQSISNQSQFNTDVCRMVNGLAIEVANLVSMVDWIKQADPELIKGYYAVKDIKEKANE